MAQKIQHKIQAPILKTFFCSIYEMSQRHPVWVAENHVNPCNSEGEECFLNSRGVIFELHFFTISLLLSEALLKPLESLSQHLESHLGKGTYLLNDYVAFTTHPHGQRRTGTPLNSLYKEQVVRCRRDSQKMCELAMFYSNLHALPVILLL